MMRSHVSFTSWDAVVVLRIIDPLNICGLNKIYILGHVLNLKFFLREKVH